jgi:hypothetical protein
MQISTANVDLGLEGVPEALSEVKLPARAGHAAEVCPLCLGRYAAALECICAACEAPSCPECAAPIAGTPEVLCYACHVPTTH